MLPVRLFALLFASSLLTACFETNDYSRPSTSANLTGLSISPGALDQVFQMRADSYTTTQGTGVSSIRVTPTAESDKAVIRVGGQSVASGAASPPIPLEPPGEDTTITVTVTAEDGSTTRSYDIVVSREAEAQFIEEAIVRGGDPQALQRFGYSIAMSGNTLAVGSPFVNGGSAGIDGSEDNDCALPAGDQTNCAVESGAVYVFVRSGDGTWAQQAYIKASNAGPGDRFGWSVSLSGNTLAVGAPFESNTANGIGGDQVDDCAADIGEQENCAAKSGAAYVFIRSNGAWTQQAYIKASDTGAPGDTHRDDRFGWSLAVAGNTLAVGAPYESSDATGVDGDQGNNFSQLSGAVYVFTRASGSWSQQAFVKASNTGAGDLFGQTVALAGDTLAVAAPSEDSSATGIDGNEADDCLQPVANQTICAANSGAVYVFTRSGTAWSQQAYIKGSDTRAGDQLGSSLALDDTTLAIGAPLTDNETTADDDPHTTPESGTVYVFTTDGSSWTEQARIKASPANAGDHFGAGVALSGDTLLIGAPFEDSAATGLIGDPTDKSGRDSGATYVFTRNDSTWSQLAYVKASNTFPFAWFGNAVGISGQNFAVASVQEGSSASQLDHRDNSADTLDGSGAVYLFR